MVAKEEDYFSAFVSISKAISSSFDLQEVLNLILEHAVNSMGMKAGAISLWNKRDNRLELIAQQNLSRDFLNKGPINADKSIPNTLTLKKPVIIPNVEQNGQLQYPEACKKEGINSVLSVPILFKDEAIGVLRLYDSKPRQFTEKELEFMQALAEQGGIAINNARFMQKMQEEHKKEMEELWDWFRSISTYTPMLDGG